MSIDAPTLARIADLVSVKHMRAELRRDGIMLLYVLEGRTVASRMIDWCVLLHARTPESVVEQEIEALSLRVAGSLT